MGLSTRLCSSGQGIRLSQTWLCGQQSQPEWDVARAPGEAQTMYAVGCLPAGLPQPLPQPLPPQIMIVSYVIEGATLHLDQWGQLLRGSLHRMGWGGVGAGVELASGLQAGGPGWGLGSHWQTLCHIPLFCLLSSFTLCLQLFCHPRGLAHCPKFHLKTLRGGLLWLPWAGLLLLGLAVRLR